MNDRLLLKVRLRDQQKQNAIIQATVALVNEIGFASSSVAKIAKRAGVSPATLYIYYENKDDLIVSTYMEIKTCLGRAVMHHLNPDLPVRDSIMQAGRNLFEHIGTNPDMFYFAEQFANSPYNNLADHEKLELIFKPLVDILQYGIAQKIIKDAPLEILFAHLYIPIYGLVNARLNPTFKATPENIELSMNMAWDAIKL